MIRRITLPLLAAVALATAASIENLPTDSRFYDDFDLLKTSGLIRSMPPASKPWTRAEAIRLVVEADSLRFVRPCGPAQRAALNRLLTEFADELPEPPAGLDSRRPLASASVPDGPDQRARFDLFSRGSASRAGQSSSIGTVLNNRPGDRFCFYDRIELTGNRPGLTVILDSSGTHSPGRRVQPWKGFVTFDMEEAYLAFKIPWLRLELGRDEFVWGPGHTGSVMLDDNAPSLNNIQVCASYPNFKFLSLSSYLSRWGTKPRFFSAQRLEVSLWNRVTLGGAMMAVASWDELQPIDLVALMNPLLPIYFTTATVGHGDNFLVGWDATVYLPQSKVYGQLFLDNYEFNARADAPNALGLQAGVYWSPNLPVELRAEYTKVTPFTYYHRRHSLMYENWQAQLGHTLGPDADQVFGSLRVTPLSWLRFTVAGDYTRRGFYNRGDYLRKSFWYESQQSHTELPDEFPSRGITSAGDTLGPDWEVERTTRILPSFDISAWRDLHVVADLGLWAARNYEGMPGLDKRGLDLDVKIEYRY